MNIDKLKAAESLIDGIFEEKLPEVITSIFQAVSASTREKIYQELRENFCTHCWGDNPRCQCWNDE